MKWVPFGVLFVGLISKWLHIDEHGIILNSGFIAYGLLSFMEGLKANYHKHFNLDTIRLALPLIVIILAADNLMTGSSNYTLLAVTILMVNILGRKGKLL